MKIKRRLLFIFIVLLMGCYMVSDSDINNIFDTILARADNELVDITGLGNLVSDKDTKSLEDSGISGSDVSVNATYYPYYNMLGDKEKAIYRQIYANVNSMKDTFVPVVEINSNELKNAAMSVFYDHPELFWLDNNYSYKYTKDGKCVQIIMSFNDTVNNIEDAKIRFNNEANKIISEASKYSSNYEKEKYVHDTIITNTSYDNNALLNQSAYSALVNKKSVCAGYARAFQYIMIKMGIPTYYVVGVAKEDHAWNIVALDDGYYNVDVTWDDQNKIIYNYFNRTDKEFSYTHTRRDLSVNLPSCVSDKYSGNNHNIVKKIIKRYKKIITNKIVDSDSNNSNNDSYNNNEDTSNNTNITTGDIDNEEIVVDDSNKNIENEDITLDDNKKNSD